MTNKYSFLVGLGKSLKNLLVVLGLPAVLYLLNGYTDWMPQSYMTMATPVIGFLTYLIKNYIENKN